MMRQYRYFAAVAATVAATVAAIVAAPAADSVGMGPSAAFALSTNSVVYVLDKSIVLPITFLLNEERTANTVGGPSLGITPSGVKMPRLPCNAATYRALSPA